MLELADAPFLQQHDGHRAGKVRDIYTFGERLLIVASDRISTYDVVLPTTIPDKGRVLNLLSAFWFRHLGTPNHLISTDLGAMCRVDQRIDFGGAADYYVGRCMLVWGVKVFPVECVVRGYLTGSGWKDYCRTGAICGIRLPAGIRECGQLPEPIFTPATKATVGHDENIPFESVAALVGGELGAEALRRLSVAIYKEGAAYARDRGIVIADTKFELGMRDGWTTALLVDEVLTPDSSRFWPADQYVPGRSQASFDKQFVRDYVDSLGWDHAYPGPELSPEIVKKTRAKYIEAYERLTERTFPWK